VEELEPETDEPQKKQNSAKKEKTETLNKGDISQKEMQESEKKVNSTEKNLKNTVAFAGTIEIAQEQEEEISSPFPIFKEGGNEHSAEAPKELSVETTEQAQIFTNQKDEAVYHHADSTNELGDNFFPDFTAEHGDSGDSPEKPIEKSTLKTSEKEVKSEGGNSQMERNLSEENKIRIEFSNSLNQEEREMIANRLIEAANLILEQEEAAWREQFSVMQNSTSVQMSEQVQINQQTSSVVMHKR
jgi:hypothetical protein